MICCPTNGKEGGGLVAPLEVEPEGRSSDAKVVSKKKSYFSLTPRCCFLRSEVAQLIGLFIQLNNQQLIKKKRKVELSRAEEEEVSV